MKKWMIRGRFCRDGVDDARRWWDFKDGQYSYSQESSFCNKREEATIYNTLRGARGMLTSFKKRDYLMEVIKDIEIVEVEVVIPGDE